MKKLYTSLFEIDRDLINENKKRENNHGGLLESLKVVNQMVQRAARLRVGMIFVSNIHSNRLLSSLGTAKTRIITACRAAIKANNIQGLFTIIKTGKP